MIHINIIIKLIDLNVCMICPRFASRSQIVTGLFALSSRETVRAHACKNQTVIARARCRISTHTRSCVHAGRGSLRLRPCSLEFVPRMRERGEAQRRRRVRDARRCAQRRLLWSGRGEPKHISEDAETKVRAGSRDGSGRALSASQCFQCF